MQALTPTQPNLIPLTRPNPCPDLTFTYLT